MVRNEKENAGGEMFSGWVSSSSVILPIRRGPDDPPDCASCITATLRELEDGRLQINYHTTFQRKFSKAGSSESCLIDEVAHGSLLARPGRSYPYLRMDGLACTLTLEKPRDGGIKETAPKSAVPLKMLSRNHELEISYEAGNGMIHKASLINAAGKAFIDTLTQPPTPGDDGARRSIALDLDLDEVPEGWIRATYHFECSVSGRRRNESAKGQCDLKPGSPETIWRQGRASCLIKSTPCGDSGGD